MELMKLDLLNKTVNAVQALTVQETVSDGRYTLRLTATGERLPGADPSEEGLVEVSAQFRFRFQADDVYFLNGYQSWTYSPERNRDQFDTSMRFVPKFLDKKYGFSQYGDGYFADPVYRKDLRNGYKKGYSYAYIRRGDRFYLFASLAERTGFTRIVLNPEEQSILFKKDCHHREVAMGEAFLGLDLYFAEGTEDEVFDGWFAAMGIKALPARPKVGYTSWYNCYQDISEAQILRDLEGMRSLKVKPDIFQIDDGYEHWVGDWFDVDAKKFPNGIQPIVQNIIDDGYQAGIWLAPFLCEKNSTLFKEHPDWLQYKNGDPVFTGANWSGGYALDFYNPEVRDYIVRSINHYKDMGITLFKLDFLYAVCMTSRPNKTRGEIMWEAMDFLREVCGDAQILGCGVPLASAFGKVEYCRIGPDMTLSYNDKLFMQAFHNERPSTLHTQRNTVYRRQLDGRAFRNDPDVFLLRDENNSLTQEQKVTLAKVNALFGSVLFGSDDFGKYDEAKQNLFAELCALQKATDVAVETKSLGKAHVIRVRYSLNGKPETLELTI